MEKNLVIILSPFACNSWISTINASFHNKFGYLKEVSSEKESIVGGGGWEE